MADDTSTPFPSGSSPDRAEGRGNRPGPGREGGARDGAGGGFRIRLSDNEMQAARALQEAFGLRSTVAVLGFALRTLAQQLEEGQLDELVTRMKAEAGSRPRGGERRRSERGEGGRGEGGRGEGGRGDGQRGGGRGEGAAGRVNPFARPSRPAPAAREEEAPTAEEVPTEEEAPATAAIEATPVEAEAVAEAVADADA